MHIRAQTMNAKEVGQENRSQTKSPLGNMLSSGFEWFVNQYTENSVEWKRAKAERVTTTESAGQTSSRREDASLSMKDYADIFIKTLQDAQAMWTQKTQEIEDHQREMTEFLNAFIREQTAAKMQREAAAQSSPPESSPPPSNSPPPPLPPVVRKARVQGLMELADHDGYCTDKECEYEHYDVDELIDLPTPFDSHPVGPLSAVDRDSFWWHHVVTMPKSDDSCHDRRSNACKMSTECEEKQLWPHDPRFTVRHVEIVEICP